MGFPGEFAWCRRTQGSVSGISRSGLQMLNLLRMSFLISKYRKEYPQLRQKYKFYVWN
jgi:hypothetical protein